MPLPFNYDCIMCICNKILCSFLLPLDRSFVFFTRSFFNGFEFSSRYVCPFAEHVFFSSLDWVRLWTHLVLSIRLSLLFFFLLLGSNLHYSKLFTQKQRYKTVINVVVWITGTFTYLLLLISFGRNLMDFFRCFFHNLSCFSFSMYLPWILLML